MQQRRNDTALFVSMRKQTLKIRMCSQYPRARPLPGKMLPLKNCRGLRENDVMAFSPYPAKDGTFGALFQLDDHGRVVLDTLSVERRGGFLFVLINGRLITELQIDKRVSDGKIYVPSGLTAADVELMKKQWRLPGQPKALSVHRPCDYCSP